MNGDRHVDRAGDHQPGSGRGAPENPRSGGSPAQVRVRLHPWASAVRPVLVWYLLALLSLYLKNATTDFYVAARYLGRIEEHNPLAHTNASGLTLWEKLSFFRSDILVAFLLIPLCLTLLNRCLPRRWRAPFTVLLSAGVTVALFLQFRAFTQLGRFISIPMFWAGISWSLEQPGAIRNYLAHELNLKICAAVFVLGTAVGWLWRSKRAEKMAHDPWAQRIWRVAGLTSIICLLLIAVISWVPRVPSTRYHEIVLLKALGALWHETDVDTGEFRGLSAPELASRYAQLTGTPRQGRDPRYWGKARGCNVIFFVLETTSARALPLEDGLEDLPNLRKLREKSFVALSHHTTYPDTRRAVFSLFSSWYDSSLTRSFIDQYTDLRVPGLIRALSGLGYATATYSPYYFANDYSMFGSMGFQQRRVPDPALISVERTDLALRWDREGRLAADVGTLGLLKQDMEQWLSKGQRFAAVFFPQISHAPLLDVLGNGDQDPVKRTRALLALEDAWLGEVLKLLEQHGQLERTVIVLAGDHGVRARWEDPSFTGGTIDEYSFHVPLLIYAPTALNHRETILSVTSHIDVAPTLLDLLGIDQERKFEQGTPIWNPDLARRTTYFFANSWLGADGYHAKGKFFMRSYLSDSVYMNERLHFDASNLVPSTSPTSLEVIHSVNQIVALQQVWATRFAGSKAMRNRLYTRGPQTAPTN